MSWTSLLSEVILGWFALSLGLGLAYVATIAFVSWRHRGRFR